MSDLILSVYLFSNWIVNRKTKITSFCDETLWGKLSHHYFGDRPDCTWRKLTGEFGYSFQDNLYGIWLARSLRVYRVKGDFRRLEHLKLPEWERWFQTPFTNDGNEFLRQTAIVSLDAGYPHPGTIHVVGRAVLQRVRSACEENAALKIARAKDQTPSPISQGDRKIVFKGNTCPFFKQNLSHLTFRPCILPCIFYRYLLWTSAHQREEWKDDFFNKMQVIRKSK